MVTIVCAEEFNGGKEAPKRREIFSAPPVIDIAPLVQPDKYTETERQNVQQAILHASSTWGLFQILNHGIRQELQQKIINEMQLFFYFPKVVKYTIQRTVNNSRGE
jgi:isopenicillin N synthase-like dioxygenase